MKFKDIIILGIVLITAAVLRLIFLDRVPSAVGGDELTYILTAKFMGLTGSDVTGTWNPFSVFFFNYPSGFPQAELPYFLLYPAVNFFGMSLLSIKTTYALFSIATVALVYFVTRELLGKRVALIAAGLAAVNPWQIFNGRTAYEMVPTTCFYLLAIFVLLRAKGLRILLAYPVFLLAFYSYIGTKVAFIPIILIVSLYSFYLNKKKFAREYIILNVLAIITVVFFAFALSHTTSTSRAGELFTPFSKDLANQVNDLRKNSIGPTIFTNLIDNKFTLYGKIFAAKTVNLFSPSYLFFQADDFVGIYNHGMFYYIDAVFLFFGAAIVLFKKRNVFAVLAGLIFASALPQIMFTSRIDIFTPHLALFMTLLLIPIAYGISFFLDQARNKIIPVLIIGIYLILVANFLHVYFFEFPLQGHFDFPSRVLASYMKRATRSQEKADLYVRIPEDAYRKQLFYTGSLTPGNLAEIKKSFATHKHTLNSLSFMSCLDMNNSDKPKKLTVYQINACPSVELNTPYLRMQQLTDGGDIYRIYNEKFCSHFAQKSYPSNLKLSQFAPENLSDQEFCETFVAR